MTLIIYSLQFWVLKPHRDAELQQRYKSREEAMFPVSAPYPGEQPTQELLHIQQRLAMRPAH